MRRALAAEPLAYPPRDAATSTPTSGSSCSACCSKTAGGAPLDDAVRPRGATRRCPASTLGFGPWRRVGAARSRRPRPTPGAGASCAARCTTPTPRRSAASPATPGCSARPAAVGAFARWFLTLWLGPRRRRRPACRRRWRRAFAARGDVPGSSRALAWDTMLPTSSCGRAALARAPSATPASPGTSLWIDPERRSLRRAAHQPRAPDARRGRRHPGAARRRSRRRRGRLADMTLTALDWVIVVVSSASRCVTGVVLHAAGRAQRAGLLPQRPPAAVVAGRDVDGRDDLRRRHAAGGRRHRRPPGHRRQLDLVERRRRQHDDGVPVRAAVAARRHRHRRRARRAALRRPAGGRAARASARSTSACRSTA